MIMSQLSTLPIENKSVFLRADANVPIVDGSIQSYFRLEALRPTLDLLTQKKATIIFATHLGRPKAIDPSLSTEQLLPWFCRNGYTAIFAPTLHDAYRLRKESKPLIILLENLRFFPGEQDGSQSLAQELVQLAEFYVDDAFATLHRKDTSVYLLPQLFPIEKRTIGLLVEKEIIHLTTLIKQPRNGYTLMLGGGKLATKIPLLKAFLQKVETIILCPAIVFTFLKAIGHQVGNSLVDDNELAVCQEIIAMADAYNTRIVYPLDYQVAESTFYGKLSYTQTSSLPKDTVGISVGPKSVAIMAKIIEKSDTIFYNGLMGTLERPETLGSSQKIFAAIAASKAYSVIAGGDTIAIIEQDHLEQRISYLSSGGGATLAFLSGEPLPGLTVLSK